MGLKNWLWLRKQTLDRQINYHQDQHDRGVDLYTSTWKSNSTTAKGLRIMIKHSKKIIKLKRYRLKMYVDSFHHSLIEQITDIVADLHDPNKRFKVWKLLKSLEEDE